MKKYSREELINILNDYSEKLGRTPKMREVAYNTDLPPIHQFLKTFGSWNNALKESNLKIKKVGVYSKKELLSILKKEAKRLGRSPKLDDFNNNKQLPCSSSYYRLLGSWNNALKKVNLKVVKKRYTNSELLELLKKKAKELGRSPFGDDINNDKGMPDRSTYGEHFGSWNNALSETGLKINAYYRKWTKEEVIKWLHYKYEELGKTPGIRDFDKDPKAPAKNTVRKLFGNWTNALRIAKIPVKRFRSKKELIEILQKLAKELSRTPTREEIKSMKKYIRSYTPFVEKFGSYTAACLSAGLTPNDGRNNKIWQNWQKHCEDMAKVIYENVEIQKEGAVEGVPDIYAPNERLFIDAKTCGYRDFKGQIKKYCKNNHKLEFWLIFKGIETKRKRIKYIYAEELARKMVKLGRKDLAIKCHQFIKNVYSEEQSTLT